MFEHPPAWSTPAGGYKLNDAAVAVKRTVFKGEKRNTPGAIAHKCGLAATSSFKRDVAKHGAQIEAGVKACFFSTRNLRIKLPVKNKMQEK